METAIKNKLASLCFEEWKTVKQWLILHGIKVEELETIVCTNTTHNITVGFDWDSLDFYTRGHQLQFILFGGKHFFELSPLINELYKARKKAK